MVHIKAKIIEILLMVILLLFVTSESGFGELTRLYDPIVIKGDKIGITGPISRFACLAINKGSLKPIPFQIDERDVSGDLVFQQGPMKIWQDEPPGIFDSNDDFVIMASDLGERAKHSALKQITGDIRQISVTDPITGQSLFAYVILTPESMPPIPKPSGLISYNPAKGLVETPFYIAGFDDPMNPAVFNTYLVKSKGGGKDVNLLDRLKVRLNIGFVFGTIQYKWNEQESMSIVKGWSEGPVRCIRRMAYSPKIIGGIPMPALDLDSMFYLRMATVEVSSFVPIDIGFGISDVSLNFILDMASAAKGMRVFWDKNPDGFIIDGSQTQLKQIKNAPMFKWVVFSGEQGTFLVRAFPDPSLNVETEMIFQDDRTMEDPPEKDLGLMGAIGLSVKNIRELKGKIVKYRFELYQLPSASHDAIINALAVRDEPLIVGVSEIRM